MRKHSLGFTVIEFGVVIAIIAILALLLLPVFARAHNMTVANAAMSYVGYQRLNRCLQDSESVAVGSLVLRSLPCGRPDQSGSTVNDNNERLLLIQDGQSGRVLVSQTINLARPGDGFQEGFICLYQRYRNSTQLYQALGQPVS